MTVSYHFTRIRLATISKIKQKITSIIESVEKQEPLKTALGRQKCTVTVASHVAVPQTLNTDLLYDPAR